MKGFVYVRSLKMASLLLVGWLGSSGAVSAPGAADKVWLDEKALVAEMKDKFGGGTRVTIRDEKFSLVQIETSLTEHDGLQIRFRSGTLRGYGAINMFLEFDKTGKLILAKSTITYDKKVYPPNQVSLSTLKLARNEPRMMLIEKMADALQKSIKTMPIKQKGTSRTPDFSAVARYTTVLVAKHVWYGPKVTDHRTGGTDREDRRGDGGR